MRNLPRVPRRPGRQLVSHLGRTQRQRNLRNPRAGPDQVPELFQRGQLQAGDGRRAVARGLGLR